MAEEQKITNGFETPVNILWDNVLLIPVFGTMDSTRAQAIMETILQKIVETGSKAIILDILGVDTVDSGVANHMIKITKACKLLGCETIISGISPEIAITLVNLGVTLSEVVTTSTLKDAVSRAFENLGLKICKEK